MRWHNPILVASALGVLAACSSSSPYYYDPYYAYYPAAYDAAYYDAAMVSGYYYPVGYYYYGYRPQAAASLDVVPPSVRLLLARWKASVDPGCITATPSADNDRDGIAASSTVTFQCSASPGGGTSEVTGAVTVRDLDDNAADAGYSVTFDGFRVRAVSGTGQLTLRVINGTETIQKRGGDLALTRDVVVDATDTFPDGVERQSKLEWRSQGTFTPELVPGSTVVTRGTLTLSGQGTFTSPEGLIFTLSQQTDPTVHWNNDCSRDANNQGFDAGAIVYRSSQGRQTRIVYDSCTNVTVTNTVP